MKDIASFPFDIPIFTTEKFDLGEKPLLVVGGGGGDSKTGVKNKLVCAHTSALRCFSRLDCL
jgi:hypothetical protein